MNIKLKHSLTGLMLTLSPSVFAKPIDAIIKLKERVSMASLAENVTDPLSARYGKFYTPAEIRALTAPSAKDYADTLKTLKSEGFQIVSESKTHLWVTIRGDHSLFQSVFGTEFGFATNKSAQETHALLREAVVPSHLSLIDTVGGLDSTRQSHHHHVVSEKKSHSNPGGGIAPASIKTAYGFDPIYKAGITGKGQDIAVATYDGFNIDDVNQYFILQGMSPAPTVDQVNFNGTAAYVEGSATETQLDAEFSGMIAPNAKVHVFPSAANSDLGELQLFTAILDDNRAKVVNYSWGDCETHLTPSHVTEMKPVFERAVAQGVNIMIASGDSGSDSCGDQTNKADWPAANPSIVAVGGTTASISSTHLSESGWNGSGGGVSAIWDLPSWQQSFSAPFTHRSYPDVSFNADPASGQAVYAHQWGFPMWMVIGGTSMAAPQWSGFMALVGQARADAGKQPLGYLNPIIYGLSSSARNQLFSDVTSGSNGLYSANVGWDAVTGFGSMKASALLTYLSNL